MGIASWIKRMTNKKPEPESIDVADAYARAEAGDLIIIDVRTPDEAAASGIPEKAIVVSLSSPDFADRVSAAIVRRGGSNQIAFFCKSGFRSGKAASVMTGMTECKPAIIEGGLDAWHRAGLPLTGLAQA